MHSLTRRLAFPTLVAMLTAAACTGDPVDPPTESPSAAPATSEAPSPPQHQDFSTELASMEAWEDPCAPVDLDPLTAQIGNLESVGLRPSVDDDPISGVTWTGHCFAGLRLPTSGNEEIFVVIDANESNTAAFEHFHDFASFTAERFSDDEVDYETTLGSDTSWLASRITAQEDPTDRSASRALAVAVLLGDFYTVEILVQFSPGEALRADCEPSAEDDCALTATELAEFMATSGYLDDLHADIEAAVEAGL